MKDYLNKILTWLGQLDYAALGWESLVLALAFGGALVVHRTWGAFLLESSSAIASGHFKRISMRSLPRIVFPLCRLVGTVVGKAIVRQVVLPVVLV